MKKMCDEIEQIDPALEYEKKEEAENGGKP